MRQLLWLPLEYWVGRLLMEIDFTNKPIDRKDHYGCPRYIGRSERERWLVIRKERGETWNNAFVVLK